MTNEQAQIILMIDPMVWKTLTDIIKKEQEIIRKSLENPGSSRDIDQYFKGGINFGEQVISYKEMAYKILHPQKDEDEIQNSNQGGSRR